MNQLQTEFGKLGTGVSQRGNAFRDFFSFESHWGQLNKESSVLHYEQVFA